MKKFLSIFIAVAMVMSFVSVFAGAPTAMAAGTLTKSPAYLQYGHVIFTGNGPTDPGTNPNIVAPKPDKYIYYTMGDIIQGSLGVDNTTGAINQIALVGYGPDGSFNTSDDVVVATAPVVNDAVGTFAIATSSVPQDGEYAIRDYTGNVLGDTYVTDIYIMYKFALDQTSLTYNCTPQVISGWVFRGDGTGAAYNSSITPAGDGSTPYTTYVHVIYPDGTDVYTSVLANGQFALALNVDQKGVYRVYVEDNYGEEDNDAVVEATEFGFVYGELTTGALSITINPIVSPINLYDTTDFQQEVVFRAVDEDGDPVTGATFSKLTGFGDNYTAYEIAPGVYKVVGIKDDGAALATFQLTATIGGATLYSNILSIPFKPLTDFNPVVSVDVYHDYKDGDSWFSDTPHYFNNDETEYAYDLLPCTVGYSLVIKPGVFDVSDPNNYMIYDVSATVSGPVSEIEDTAPVDDASPWLNNSGAPDTFNNIITTVGDPALAGIVYDGNYGGKDNYLVAPRYLVTGPGTITVDFSQLTWKRVDPTCDLDAYNACCDAKEATFTVCETQGCTVTPEDDSSYLTVGTPQDIKIDITSAGMSCGCDVIVHVVPDGFYSNSPSDFFTLSNGQKVPDLWFNLPGADNSGTLPLNKTVDFNPSSLGATYVNGVVTFPGVTANYCDYIKVEVFSKATTTGCSPTSMYPFASIDPFAIYAGKASMSLGYQVEGITDSENNYLVAGVPDTVTITGFVPGGELGYVRFNLGGDYYNTDSSYTAVDNGDGSYTIAFNPPPSAFGTAYPADIKVKLIKYAEGDEVCSTVGYVTIPIKSPEYETTISTGCGEDVPNDNIITEGFVETLTLTKLVDPRTGNPLTPTSLNVYNLSSSDECYLPTAWSHFEPCEGCSTTAIDIIAEGNPNVKAEHKIRPYVELNGVKVRLYGEELTVTPPTISVDPSSDIPWTGATPEISTLMTFTAIDAHGKPLCGRSISIGEYAGCCSNGWMMTTPLTNEEGTVQYMFTPTFNGWYVGFMANDVDPTVYDFPCYMLNHVKNVKYGGVSVLFSTVYQKPAVDTEAPVIEVTAPEDGATVDTDTVKVEGTVTDNVGVTELYVGSQKVSFAPDGSFSATVELAEGENTIKVFAFDAAGNKAEKDLTVTYASAKKTVVTVQIGSDVMTVNGQVEQLDVAPVIHEGHTYLPLRAIAEALGAKVDWIAETKGITLTLGDDTVGLQIGNVSAVVNGNVVAIFPPYLQPYGDGTYAATMVPLRVIAEGLGAEVNWDPATRVVTITLVQP